MARPLCHFTGLTRDWLDVRVPLAWDDAPGWFATAIGGEVADFAPPGRSGYRAGMKAVQPVNAGSVSIMGDHPASRAWSMLSCTGSAAEWGWNMAAVAFSVAQANRVDAALDFHCSQRAFDRMFDDLRGIARGFDRRPHPVGEADWGRTCYVNWAGKKGLEATPNLKMPQYTARLYEKGKEMGADPEWRRWEVSVRPDKPLQKERVFLLEPGEILGSPGWSRAFLDSIGYSDAVKPDRASPFASTGPVSVDAKVAKRMCTLSHMGEQYGEAVRDLVKLVGESEARRLVELALFRPVVVQNDGSEISGPALVRREAQQRWGDVFEDGKARRIHDKGEGGRLH